MKKAVIYVRRSREDKNSIQNQIKFLSVFVSKLNLNMYKVYCDEGYSGEDFERPSFLLMKEDIQKGLIDVVIVKDLSRIGRSLYKVGNFIENILHKYHIRFISVVDKIDTINKMSYDEIMFKNLFNELYLKDYKKKINNSLEILGNKKKITRCMKYGYKNINGERCIDEYACLIIRRIFELANNGFNSKKISDILNKENIIPRAKYMKEVLGVKSNHLYHISDKWNSQMIRNILIDKEYCGYIINFRYSKKNNVEIENRSIEIIEEEKFIRLKENETIRNSFKDQKKDNILKLIKNKNIRYLYANRRTHKYYYKEKHLNISVNSFHEIIFISVINLIDDRYIDLLINKLIMKINKLIRKYTCLKSKYINVYEKYVSRKISYNEFNDYKNKFDKIFNKFCIIEKYSDFKIETLKRIFSDYIRSDKVNRVITINKFVNKIIIDNVNNDINLYVYLEKFAYIENIIGY